MSTEIALSSLQFVADSAGPPVSPGGEVRHWEHQVLSIRSPLPNRALLGEKC
jgi:hypothetical protein